MSYRSRHGSLPLAKAFFGIVVLGLLIPLVFFAMIPTEPIERELYAEGLITEKNIERGFGNGYIFVLNGTTDLAVNKWQYNDFHVGDYIEVYIIFLSVVIEKVSA